MNELETTPDARGLPREMSQSKLLRDSLHSYTQRSDRKAITLFVAFYAKLVAFVALALYVDSFWLRLGCSIAAGTAISSLFVIAHDCAHGCYTSNKRLDAVLGRLAMLPALHNFTLWRIVHDRIHHSETCVQGFNSWSPLSKDEFEQLRPWRRALEMFYRTPAGFGPYYAIQRWLKEKFMPPAHLRDIKGGNRWLDFALILAFLALLAVIFWFASAAIVHLSYAQAWLWGFGVPFVVWSYLMGFTAYIQHTHPRVPWFRTRHDAERAGAGQHDLSVHMVFPRWFATISNNIMEHPAHHVNTKVPLYNLAAAQSHLNELIGPASVIERFTPAVFLGITRHCKLYDYDNQRWLGFDGARSEAWPAQSLADQYT